MLISFQSDSDQNNKKQQILGSLCNIIQEYNTLPRRLLADLRTYLEQIVKDAITETGHSPMPDLFGNLNIIKKLLKLPTYINNNLYNFRKLTNTAVHSTDTYTEQQLTTGFQAICELLPFLFPSILPGEMKALMLTELKSRAVALGPKSQVANPEIIDHSSHEEVTELGRAKSIDELKTEKEDDGFEEVTFYFLVDRIEKESGFVHGEIIKDEESFNSTIKIAADSVFSYLFNILKEFDYLALLDVRIEIGTSYLLPKAIIYQPDYLINITDIADAANNPLDVQQVLAISNLFEPREIRQAIFEGNLKNQILDSIIQQEAQGEKFDLDKFIKETLFANHALELTVLYPFDEDVKKLVEILKRHGNNLQKVTDQGLINRVDVKADARPLDPKECMLEPSFISPELGLQGRLDLLHLHDQGYTVIELKGGSTPNDLGAAWEAHTNQARLYMMMLEKVYRGKTHGKGWASILYSGDDKPDSAIRQVRFDPFVESTLLMARNIVAYSDLLIASQTSAKAVKGLIDNALNSIKVDKIANSITNGKVKLLIAINSLDPLPRDYLYEFMRFNLAEKQISKIGSGDMDRADGLRQLWRSTAEEKTQQYQMLDGLTVDFAKMDGIKSGEIEYLFDQDPEARAYLLIFKFGELSGNANFRRGDVVVVYPRAVTKNSKNELLATQNQIIRGSVVSCTENELIITIKHRYVSRAFLEAFEKWAVERDQLDSSLTSDIKLVVARMLDKSLAQVWQLLLGVKAPAVPINNPLNYTFKGVSEEQKFILQQAISSPNYYLLVGPPGTGKTRIIFKNLLEYYAKNTTNRVLCMAFTNRAVDEMCEQLIEAEIPFIRIGSRLSTGAAYRNYLLNSKIAIWIKEYDNRKSAEKGNFTTSKRQYLKDKLVSTYVFIGTSASLNGILGILTEFMAFDVAIVDEASQLLEHQIVPVLALVPKFILIGDHKQLAAVATQPQKHSAVDPESPLFQLGFTNLRNSLFERLYLRCQTMGWNYALGTLTVQGRMHQEIAEFPSSQYYDGLLKIFGAYQSESFNSQHFLDNEASPLDKALASGRLLYYPSTNAIENQNTKVHEEEARKVVEIVAQYAKMWGGHLCKPSHGQDEYARIGVIAPYRNQVATIRKYLYEWGLAQPNNTTLMEELECLTVDTVERYQGSQREVIILSLCLNSQFQFRNLIAMDDTMQVDRKLNVSLTRAQQQLIILGNPDLMKKEPLSYSFLYKHLVDKAIQI